MKEEVLFYISAPQSDHGRAGPYDIVQMAGLLRRKIITAETMTLLKGESEWRPFFQQQQFILVGEIPQDAVSMRTDAVEEQIQEKTATLFPVPSTEFLVQVAVMVVGLLVLAAVGYFLGRMDEMTGKVIMIVAGGVAAVAQVMILATLLDEDYVTFLLVAFIPFFDIYYFVSNIDKYWPYFLAKYAGAILAFAAAMGAGLPISH